MKTEQSIYMDFAAAKNKAKQLRNVASRMQALADNDTQGTLQEVRRNWTGENANAYIRKGNAWQARVRKLASEITGAADAIDNIAQQTYNAEKRALAIARARSYNSGGGGYSSGGGGNGSYGSNGGGGFGGGGSGGGHW